MDPVIQTFKNDFDRFYDMLIMQIDVCPDNLWTAKEGGYFYWQQVLHAIGVTEMYTVKDGDKFSPKYGMPVIMLSEEPADYLSKDELRELALDVREKVYDYLNSLKPEQLLTLHPFFTKALKKDTNYLAMLIALVRHLCYHIGCLDSVLRNNGLKGVY